MRLRECVFTVFSLTNSRPAISRLLNPVAMSPRISISRGVIPSWLTRVSSGDERTHGLDRRLRRDFLDDHFHGFFLVSVCPSQMPSPANRAATKGAVNLHRMLDDQEAVLRQLQDGDEQ